MVRHLESCLREYADIINKDFFSNVYSEIGLNFYKNYCLVTFQRKNHKDLLLHFDETFDRCYMYNFEGLKDVASEDFLADLLAKMLIKHKANGTYLFPSDIWSTYDKVRTGRPLSENSEHFLNFLQKIDSSRFIISFDSNSFKVNAKNYFLVYLQIEKNLFYVNYKKHHFLKENGSVKHFLSSQEDWNKSLNYFKKENENIEKIIFEEKQKVKNVLKALDPKSFLMDNKHFHLVKLNSHTLFLYFHCFIEESKPTVLAFMDRTIEDIFGHLSSNTNFFLCEKDNELKYQQKFRGFLLENVFLEGEKS